MTGAADRLFDRAAGKLQGFGFADDAEFLRKLKPSLVLARTRGRTSTGAPTNGGGGTQRPARSLPRPKAPGAPHPLLIVGVALAAGIVLARLLDSRGHGR
jgi:hypothetical protein